MNDTRLAVGDARIWAGASNGLVEWTALVPFRVDAPIPDIAAAEARIRAGVAQLCPAEPLAAIADADWPRGFLVSGEPEAGQDVAAWWLAAWLVAVTVAIQRWARDPVWRGTVVRAEQGELLVAVPWRRTGVLRAAAETAAEFVSRWVWPDGTAVPPQLRRWLQPDRETPCSLSSHFGERWPAIQGGGISPTTQRFVIAAMNRGIPFDVLPGSVQLGWGANAERIDMTLSGHTGWMGCTLARNRWGTNQTLHRHGIPVPRAALATDFEEARRGAEAIGWPVAIKPAQADKTIGAVSGITDVAGLQAAFDRRPPNSRMVVEKHVDGYDYRLLVVNGRVLAVTQRVPAGVTGDGVHTVARLVEFLNSDVHRGTGTAALLNPIRMDDEAKRCLAAAGMDGTSVPKPGQRIPLRRLPHIADGGTAVDVTRQAHRDNVALAVRAARIVGLDIAGVDLILPDISRSWREVGGVVCDLNAQTGLRPHRLAQPDRDLEGDILDTLLAGRPTRIPVVAFSGAECAAASAELLQCIWLAAEVPAGVCTSRVLRIDSDVVRTDDHTGRTGTRAILIDPAMHAAALELPPDRLLSEGHPCDRYSVVAVLGGSAAAQELELPERAVQALIVNADDPACLAAANRTSADRTVLVSRDRGNQALVAHLRQGGDAVFADESGQLVAAGGDSTTTLLGRSAGLPVTYAGAAAWALGIAPSTIAEALESSTP